MAFNNGSIKYSGNLDGKVGYYRNGKHVLQMKGGFDGARTKTEARYLGTRQRQNEFGRCSSLAALLKQSLQWYLDFVPDVYIFNWIQSGMLAVKACDVVSPKGEKTVLKGLDTAAGRSLMGKYQFNRKCSLSAVFTARVTVDFENGIFSVPKFTSKGHLRFLPKKDTMTGFQFLLLRIDFDAMVCSVTKSDLFLYTKESGAIGDLSAAVAIPEGDGLLLGICFAGYCDAFRDDLLWLRHPSTVMGVVGVGI